MSCERTSRDIRHADDQYGMPTYRAPIVSRTVVGVGAKANVAHEAQLRIRSSKLAQGADDWRFIVSGKGAGAILQLHVRQFSAAGYQLKRVRGCGEGFANRQHEPESWRARR